MTAETQPATLAAIVPAAGCGTRVGLGSNKILANLGEKPLLAHTLYALAAARQALCAAGFDLQTIVIAARKDEWELIRPLTQQSTLPVQLVEGGATRQDSVRSAVQSTAADYVLVHDAARPLVSVALIVAVAKAARSCDGAIAALPASDTIKLAAQSTPSQQQHVGKTLDRKYIWLAQTPQVFRRDVFLKAHLRAVQEGFSGTDCASLVERCGGKVALVEGEKSNIKVTFRSDFEWAARELSRPNPTALLTEKIT